MLKRFLLRLASFGQILSIVAPQILCEFSPILLGFVHESLVLEDGSSPNLLLGRCNFVGGGGVESESQAFAAFLTNFSHS